MENRIEWRIEWRIIFYFFYANYEDSNIIFGTSSITKEYEMDVYTQNISNHAMEKSKAISNGNDQSNMTQ